MRANSTPLTPVSGLVRNDAGRTLGLDDELGR
jgi:hypothetical protein